MAHWADLLPSKAAEPGNIEKFIIKSDYTDDLDISMGIVELHYYESILDTTVRVTAQVVDSSLRKAAIQKKIGYEAATENDQVFEAPGDDNTTLTGGEKVELSFSDNAGNQLSFPELRVQATRNQMENSKANVFIIDVFSSESIKNEFTATRVEERYQGKISDSVTSILRGKLQTDNTIEIDQTLNEMTFNGNTQKPLYKCVWLAKRSVPEEQPGALGGTAGYFFWESANEGGAGKRYCFKSIDLMMAKGPKVTLKYSDTPSSDIKHYEFTKNTDVKEKISNAAFSSSQLRTLTPWNEAYGAGDNSSTSVEEASELGGTEHPKIAKDLNLPNTPTKIAGKFTDTGTLPKGFSLGEQLPRSKQKDFDVDAIMRQSQQRYNQLFTFKLSITIPGNFGIRAGDTIFVDFPQQEWKDTRGDSKLKGGKYMVVDVCHLLRTEDTYTKLNLVRESVFK